MQLRQGFRLSRCEAFIEEKGTNNCTKALFCTKRWWFGEWLHWSTEWVNCKFGWKKRVNIRSLWEFNPIERLPSSGWPTFFQVEEQYFFSGRRQLLQVQLLLISPAKVLPDFELHTLTKTCGGRRLWWQSPPPPNSDYGAILLCLLCSSRAICSSCIGWLGKAAKPASKCTLHRSVL